MIDTFSGIGGFSLAARWLGGIETVQFVEREPYCQRILRKHWPDVPIHDDICTFNPAPGTADIVCGGFPCQDISTAGRQAGIKEGTRSGLFYELMRVVRMVGPRYVVLENVAAITSNGLDVVLGTLAEAGFDAEWACIPAADVGACHRRDRWWCVAYANDARVETQGPEQLAARAEQHRELDAAYASGEGRRQITGSASGNEGQDEGRAALHDYIAGSAGKKRNGAADDASHPHHPRLEGRQPAGMRQRAQQWPAGAGDSHRLNPDWRGYLSEPVLRRGDDGLSGRVDRLRALGNAVVPQVAAIPLARVLELENV
jgi:DNA (cytosine-5)-methyltransferase 1